MSATELPILPIACSLPESELRSRIEEIDLNISDEIESVIELQDGYEFRFPGGEEWVGKLAEFVRQERVCCRFLQFELVFEPYEGRILMRLRGPDGAKEFIKNMLEG